MSMSGRVGREVAISFDEGFGVNSIVFVSVSRV